MVAGEYAVLEPNYELIVMAVNRFVYATLTTDDTYTLTLENFNLTNIPWELQEGTVHIYSEDERTNFVQQAMEIALNYLTEQNVLFTPFHLTIKSELDDTTSKQKYGLGSSAAVVTAVISVILEKYAPTLATKDTIF